MTKLRTVVTLLLLLSAFQHAYSDCATTDDGCYVVCVQVLDGTVYIDLYETGFCSGGGGGGGSPDPCCNPQNQPCPSTRCSGVDWSLCGAPADGGFFGCDNQYSRWVWNSNLGRNSLILYWSCDYPKPAWACSNDGGCAGYGECNHSCNGGHCQTNDNTSRGYGTPCQCGFVWECWCFTGKPCS